MMRITYVGAAFLCLVAVVPSAVSADRGSIRVSRRFWVERAC